MTSALRVAALAAANMGTSVSVVLVNKWLFNRYNFRFPSFVTLVHFLFTYLGVIACKVAGIYQPKPLKWRDVMPIAASFCGFVALTNLSLNLNVVGTYQVFKIMTTPVIMAIEYFVYGKTISLHKTAALALVCIGAVVVSTSDVKLTLVGTFVASLATVVTSCHQIWIGTYQKGLNANSMQLMQYQMPLSCVFMVPIVLTMDNVFTNSSPGQHSLVHQLGPGLDVTAMTVLAFSAALAFGVNLSTFLIIGETSPITYNVIGHAKSCIIIVGGFIIFQYPVTSYNVIGILLTMTGIIWYSSLKLRPENVAQEKMKAQHSTSGVTVSMKEITSK